MSIDGPADTSAGALGSQNCDLPLDAARIHLEKLKEKLLEEFDEINIVVVTGNVVTDQPGQLDAQDHIDTVKGVYAVIQEVFSESYILPVLGSTDTYPSHFFPFSNRTEIENWLPNIPKKDQYRDQSVKVVNAILDEWEDKYPFSLKMRQLGQDVIGFDPTSEISEYGYYKLENVPY